MEGVYTSDPDSWCNGDISTVIGLSPNLDWRSIRNCCVDYVDFGISHGNAAVCPVQTPM